MVDDSRITNYIKDDIGQRELAKELLTTFAPYLRLIHHPDCSYYHGYDNEMCSCGLRERILIANKWIKQFRFEDLMRAIAEFI